MRPCGSCGTWVGDADPVCASCGKDPGVPRAATPTPPQPSPLPEPEPGPDLEPARMRVRRLGGLYMVMGGVQLLSMALSYYQFATGAALRQLADMRADPDLRNAVGPSLDEYVDRIQELWESPHYLALAHGIPFLIAVLLIYSGNRLRGLDGRTLGIVAACLTFPLICAPGGCCCLPAALGVYALFVLTKGETAVVLRG